MIGSQLFYSAELEDREYQATLHVRDSVQLVENALLEKEQVCYFSHVKCNNTIETNSKR